ncbi:hypothetical protein POVWA2_054690 [Plasmodium ovale wallikeri]|uniref:Uncharacterized protein n=1 Tax=Plasmodium ovale wallikeri TaxID=864142 RepID=A0A1A8ZU09_PLAOA|nr:hypothetical protein POVWA1_056040 [Plasmodium ovale wallikeri]SBT47730.1 hypothetical protein POVWA2_054690 [Plasmodium ovale wallikeri]
MNDATLVDTHFKELIFSTGEGYPYTYICSKWYSTLIKGQDLFLTTCLCSGNSAAPFQHACKCALDAKKIITIIKILPMHKKREKKKNFSLFQSVRNSNRNPICNSASYTGKNSCMTCTGSSVVDSPSFYFFQRILGNITLRANTERSSETY